MGINFNDADGIEPELLEQAVVGEKAMNSSADKGNAVISPETVKNDDGGGGGGQKSFNDVLVSTKKNMNVVDTVIAQGGFTGPDKDKFDISKAHSEWVKARNQNINCPNQIVKTSVHYTTLVNGRASQNEIIKADQQRTKVKDTCNKSDDLVLEKAKKYVEIDRRVNENRLKEQNTYPIETMTTNVEKFQVRGSVIEGFNYYNVDSTPIANPTSTSTTAAPGGYKYNQRLPRYADPDTKQATGTDKTILPWTEYYTLCSGATATSCEEAHRKKDQYISSINYLFDQAEQKLNVYYNAAITLTDKNPNSSNSLSNLLVNTNTVNVSIDNQKKDIALYKQKALYNYDQYNSLSFIEDLVNFLYYAVFAILIFMTLREIYSSTAVFDKRNIIILILLGIYPKYVLSVALWILNGLTTITQMLGLKNVSFWY